VAALLRQSGVRRLDETRRGRAQDDAIGGVR